MLQGQFLKMALGSIFLIYFLTINIYLQRLHYCQTLLVQLIRLHIYIFTIIVVSIFLKILEILEI